MENGTKKLKKKNIVMQLFFFPIIQLEEGTFLSLFCTTLANGFRRIVLFFLGIAANFRFVIMEVS